MFHAALLGIWPLPPVTMVEFAERRLWIDEAVSVRNLQFKNAREEVFEIVHFAPYEECITRVLSQVVCAEPTKWLQVEPLLIVGTVAARAIVQRIIPPTLRPAKEPQPLILRCTLYHHQTH